MEMGRFVDVDISKPYRVVNKWRDHRCRLRGCFGARAFMVKLMWVLSTCRSPRPFCSFLHRNAWE